MHKGCFLTRVCDATGATLMGGEKHFQSNSQGWLLSRERSHLLSETAYLAALKASIEGPSAGKDAPLSILFCCLLLIVPEMRNLAARSCRTSAALVLPRLECRTLLEVMAMMYWSAMVETEASLGRPVGSWSHASRADSGPSVDARLPTGKCRRCRDRGHNVLHAQPAVQPKSGASITSIRAEWSC